MAVGTTSCKVEIRFDGVNWTDVSVYADDDSISIDRGGGGDELDEIQTGTASFVLQNADADFTPRNASSIYYPNVRKQVEVRISVTSDAAGGGDPETSVRFYGRIQDWNPVIEGDYSQVAVPCADVFKRLGERPLQPLTVEETLYYGPLAYYRLDEESGATEAGDVAGIPGVGAAMIDIAGGGATEALQFGEGTGPSADGLSCVSFAPTSSTVGRWLLADLGAEIQQRSSIEFIGVQAWFSTTTVSRTICSLQSPDGLYRITFGLTAGGLMRIRTVEESGGSSDVSVGSNIADGAAHHLLYDEVNSSIWVDGVQYASVVDVMYGLRQLSIGGRADTELWVGDVAHVAFWAGPDLSAAAPFMYSAGVDGFAGEDSDVVAALIAEYAGVTVTTSGTTFGPTSGLGAGASSVLDALQKLATTEAGKVYADRASSNTVIYESRDVRYNQAAALTLDYATNGVDGDLGYTDNDATLVNIVNGSRPGGASIRVLDQDSIDTYGERSRPLDTLCATHNDLVGAAEWVVYRRADPAPRLTAIPVEAATRDLADYRDLLDTDISTVIALDNLPDQAPGADETVVIEGYTEKPGLATHEFVFRTSPAFTDDIWEIGVSELGINTRIAR